MENKSYHHNDLKTELVRQGLKIIDSEGIEGLSLRKVAKACGVSQTAPYRHFKNKDELVAEILLQALDAFNESLLAAVSKHPDSPRDQIKEMGIAYIHFFMENPQYLRLLFLSDMQLTSSETFCAASAHLSKSHPFDTFSSAVQRYKDSAPDETRDIHELLVYCWGLVHGVAVLASRKEIPAQYDVSALVSNIIWNERFL